MAQGSLILVGEAVSLSDALPLLRLLKPTVDLVVCDQPEGLAQPFDALKRVTREFPKMSVVILADQLDAAQVDKAIAAGASGFLPKSISPAALGLSLELITLGENLFTAPAALWRHRPTRSEPHPAANNGVELSKSALTHRQRQILEYLEAGLSNRAIAEKLDVAEATVKVHVRSLLLRINVDNRTQAALWAKSQK